LHCKFIWTKNAPGQNLIHTNVNHLCFNTVDLARGL